MKHETLPVYLDRDPFDLADDNRIIDSQRYHMPSDRLVIERFTNSVIVEVAIHQLDHFAEPSTH